jgi:hypothetical protein
MPPPLLATFEKTLHDCIVMSPWLATPPPEFAPIAELLKMSTRIIVVKFELPSPPAYVVRFVARFLWMPQSIIVRSPAFSMPPEEAAVRPPVTLRWSRRSRAPGQIKITAFVARASNVARADGAASGTMVRSMPR